jgi:hypothetical protein
MGSIDGAITFSPFGVTLTKLFWPICVELITLVTGAEVKEGALTGSLDRFAE